MNIGAAFLCDSASVREGLLHVLGGGITRLWRDQYPAPMNVALALLLELDRTELGRPHQLEITVMGEDGADIARVEGGFQSPPNPNLDFGEDALVPFIIPLQPVGLPNEGRYVISIMIDNVARKRLDFAARPQPPQALPPS
jgi:hypothetical protein